MNKLITSSVSPERVSLTVRGLLFSLLPIIMYVTGLPEATLEPILDVIVDSVFFATALVSSAMTVYGLIRKAINKRWSA